MLKNVDEDFAAIIAPGLRLAFRDRVSVVLDGRTIFNEHARRKVWVCGPAAFIAMKALAFRGRGENKDAYNLAYVLRNHSLGIPGIADSLRPMLDDREAANAIAHLREDFATIDSVGPRRMAEFLGAEEDVRADTWGVVRDLLDRLPD